ncbi:DUF7344 domain-containing protein [Halostagnicola bangensis]
MSFYNYSEKGEDCASGFERVETEPNPDVIFRALSHRRRRCVLHHLHGVKQAKVTELTRQIGSWEEKRRTETTSDGVLREIKTSLLHTHLPVLHDAKLIEYDERTTTAIARGLPEIVVISLEYCVPIDFPE